MRRSQLSMRPAEPRDATVLTEVWGDVLRRGEREEQVADVQAVIERVEPLEDERIVVAEYDGQVVGAVHLRATTLSPLNLEPVVQTVSPHVLPPFRRHGVGRALMEASVAFAEEHGIAHIATAAVAGSRDANRFMARLALAPVATLRLASTQLVKAKLTNQGPVTGRTSDSARQLTHVLAARRSMRRSQARSAK